MRNIFIFLKVKNDNAMMRKNINIVILNMQSCYSVI